MLLLPITHSKYIIEAGSTQARTSSCEKPIDYCIWTGFNAAINAAKEAGVKLQMRLLAAASTTTTAQYTTWFVTGKVGKVNIIKISSRDPEPPTGIDYVKVSGGIFYDMMVHDFDMARFLAGSEVTEVYAVTVRFWWIPPSVRREMWIPPL